MTHGNDVPLYNLKAVVRETGLKPDTVRAWERRYNLPSPRRAPSGHRLYTQRDIEILKWLTARLGEGLNISRAVALWQEVHKEQSSAPVLQTVHREAVARADGESAHGLSPAPGDTIAALRERWLNAVLSFNEATADQALSEAFGLFSIESVCLEILQHGLAEIGAGWERGAVTVQQEHFASELALRRIETLIATTPPPTRPEGILIGCPPEESHTFVPLLLALLLRRRGYPVVYLGANVPLPSLERTVEATRPALVILPAQQLHTAANLLEIAPLLQAQAVPLAFGGRIFNALPELRSAIPGHFLGSDLPGAVLRVDEILARPQLRAERGQPAHAEQTALLHFQERRAAIEASVWAQQGPTRLDQRYLAAANAQLGRGIVAALAFGNLDLLATARLTLEDALARHSQMPRERTRAYLAAYRAAAHVHLGPEGAPVLRWLDGLLAQPNVRRAPNAGHRTPSHVSNH